MRPAVVSSAIAPAGRQQTAQQDEVYSPVGRGGFDDDDDAFTVRTDRTTVVASNTRRRVTLSPTMQPSSGYDQDSADSSREAATNIVQRLMLHIENADDRASMAHLFLSGYWRNGRGTIFWKAFREVVPEHLQPDPINELALDLQTALDGFPTDRRYELAEIFSRVAANPVGEVAFQRFPSGHTSAGHPSTLTGNSPDRVVHYAEEALSQTYSADTNQAYRAPLVTIQPEGNTQDAGMRAAMPRSNAMAELPVMLASEQVSDTVVAGMPAQEQQQGEGFFFIDSESEATSNPQT